MKFSAPGGTIIVETGIDTDGKSVAVRVTDRGQGMSEEDIALAFQRFQRLSAQPTGGESSTGLGLAIVKAIAEAHGGSVETISPGKGAGSTSVCVCHTPARASDKRPKRRWHTAICCGIAPLRRYSASANGCLILMRFRSRHPDDTKAARCSAPQCAGQCRRLLHCLQHVTEGQEKAVPAIAVGVLVVIEA